MFKELFKLYPAGHVAVQGGLGHDGVHGGEPALQQVPASILVAAPHSYPQLVQAQYPE